MAKTMIIGVTHSETMGYYDIEKIDDKYLIRPSSFTRCEVLKPIPDLIRYRHCDGGLYQLVTTAYMKDTNEKFVLYRSETTGLYWIRPHDMFFGFTLRDGKSVQRFTEAS